MGGAPLDEPVAMGANIIMNSEQDLCCFNPTAIHRVKSIANVIPVLLLPYSLRNHRKGKGIQQEKKEEKKKQRR